MAFYTGLLRIKGKKYIFICYSFKAHCENKRREKEDKKKKKKPNRMTEHRQKT